jgi:hypothetical protein
MDTPDTTTPAPKMRTITLTGRPPVRIREDAWPIIAHGHYLAYDGQIECQSSCTITIDICVRAHADGRHIVYGTYIYETRWQGERGCAHKAGVLCLPGWDVVGAIRDVGDALSASADDGQEDAVDATVRDCIADLPAEDVG